MLRFDDQVALITGAGRGIGRQHALFLAGRGARIVVNDYGGGLRGENGNNPAPADAVVAEIQAAGGSAMAACCDIGDAGQVQAMVDAAIERFGRLDVVIHNASTFAKLGSFLDARAEDLQRIMRVNALGGWNVAHAAWGPMVARGYGRVVMTGSAAGFFGRHMDQAYSVAKSALMGLTKVLATEGESLGIKVNLVGPAAWTGTSQAMGMPPALAEFTPPIFVSNLVAVLAHADCPVNGEMFHCGGGLVARVFVGETPGEVFAAETMTPETVLAGMSRVMEEAGYIIPASTDHSGARLSAAIAAVNPAFAAVVAEAKQSS